MEEKERNRQRYDDEGLRKEGTDRHLGEACVAYQGARVMRAALIEEEERRHCRCRSDPSSSVGRWKHGEGNKLSSRGQLACKLASRIAATPVQSMQARTL
jgi:hypothetical protein